MGPKEFIRECLMGGPGGGRQMTYKDALSQFNALIRPTVPPKDRPAIREAWCGFIDSLQRAGRITLKQCDWIGPQR